MKLPRYALFVAPNNADRAKIMREELTISIRPEHRDYREGAELMLCCPYVPWVVAADITHVRHCELQDVTVDEIEALGLPPRADELLNFMSKFYSDIDWESPVTVIRWDNVRGDLVDRDKENRLGKKVLMPRL